MKKINTILFDLDGTLIDSNELIIDSFRETFKKYLPSYIFSRQELIDMIGPPLLETFKIVTEDPKKIQEMIDYYRAFYIKNEFDYVNLYAHVIEMLDYFNKQGFNLAIVTTKYSTSALPAIKHFGIDKYIKTYSFLNDVKNHKPHPEPVMYALNQFKHVEEAIMVGDNTADIMAGKNAKIHTCAVNWSIKKELINQLNPTFSINSYSDLVEIIKKYNREN